MGFDLLRQRHPLGCRKGRCETDQIELAMCVVEPEQKRSAATLCVLAVATDHAVGGSQLLHLPHRSDEHTSELQSLMRISYAVFCLKKKKQQHHKRQNRKPMN